MIVDKIEVDLLHRKNLPQIEIVQGDTREIKISFVSEQNKDFVSSQLVGKINNELVYINGSKSIENNKTYWVYVLDESISSGLGEVWVQIYFYYDNEKTQRVSLHPFKIYINERFGA